MDNNQLSSIFGDDVKVLKVALDTNYSFEDILSIHPRKFDFQLIPALKRIGMEEGGSMSGKDLWLKTYKFSCGFIDPKGIVIKTVHMEANGTYSSEQIRDAINLYLGLN
jgi:hypothetical protein